MTPNEYVAKMSPYAQQASGGTGLPSDLVLAQWAHETGWGSSRLALNHNNHGGIKWTENADYAADEYSGYESLASFAKDYVRVINLSYYAALRQAAAAGRPAEELAGLFGPYAEDPAYAGKLRSVLQTVRSVSPTPGSPLTAIQDGDTIHVTGAGLPRLSGSALAAVAVVVGAILLFSRD